MQELLDNESLRQELYEPDILLVTSPCNGRTVLREELGIPAEASYSEDELFLMQTVIIRLLKPKRVISEMTPPNENHHEDHREVARSIEKCGYQVITTDRFPSDLCGDIQHRERWILIARKQVLGKKSYRSKIQRLTSAKV